MMRHTYLEHQFVEQLPEHLREGVLYISIKYAIAAHLCGCGCGKEVVTPFTPTDWKMTYDGETISLSPSIGNWNFPCRSHYFIRRGRIVEAESWADEQVEAGRRHDKIAKANYYGTPELTNAVQPTPQTLHHVKTSKVGSSLIGIWFSATKKFWKNLRHRSKS